MRQTQRMPAVTTRRTSMACASMSTSRTRAMNTMVSTASLHAAG